MTVLVTGGAGYLGSHMVYALLWIARCGARQSHNRLRLGGAAGRVVCDQRCQRSIAGRSADRRASGRRHIRDYIHASDLVAAHSDALAYLRGGGASTTLNCGYGRGFSALDVIEPVKRRLQGGVCGPPGRRSASPRHRLRPYPLDAQMGSRVMTICKPSSPTLWHRSAGYNAPHLTLTFADPLETASDRARGGSLGATEP